MPVDALVLRRRLRAMERTIRVLRELRARGRDAFSFDEATQDRVARNAQLLAQDGRVYDELGWIDDAVAFAIAIETWLETSEPA